MYSTILSELGRVEPTAGIIYTYIYSASTVFLSGQETEYKGVLKRVDDFAEEEGRRPRILVRQQAGESVRTDRRSMHRQKKLCAVAMRPFSQSGPPNGISLFFLAIACPT